MYRFFHILSIVILLVIPERVDAHYPVERDANRTTCIMSAREHTGESENLVLSVSINVEEDDESGVFHLHHPTWEKQVDLPLSTNASQSCDDGFPIHVILFETDSSPPVMLLRKLAVI